MDPTELYGRIEAAGGSRVGPRSSSSTTPDGIKVIDDSPATLAASAGLSLDVYALARMVQSEDGGAAAPVLLALAECARNKAARRGVSVATLLLVGTRASASGKFSEQAGGKWASTARDPHARHVEAARIAVDEQSAVFGGVVDFFDPRSQDSGRQGTHTLSQTSEDYIRDRARERLQWIGQRDGINPYTLMLFEPVAGHADTAGALGVVASRGSVSSGTSDAEGDSSTVVDGVDVGDALGVLATGRRWQDVIDVALVIMAVVAVVEVVGTFVGE